MVSMLANHEVAAGLYTANLPELAYPGVLARIVIHLDLVIYLTLLCNIECRYTSCFGRRKGLS